MVHTGERQSRSFAPPERIGPYRVLQQIGEGGMGVVYEAEEIGPVRRRVALKVVKDGLGSHEVLARFDAERQALAVMNHPGIARVLHAGATDAGAPYFAMELVRGLPITRFCDMNRVTVHDRLVLFADVCAAVQHAHQKGVIHRDLKPSNILVLEEQGQLQAKIIDFGIAKALGPQLTERTLVTGFGQALGTAAYMSPEQAEFSGHDVDTRADIYSLGVVLYELLVGELPVDPTQVGLHVFFARLTAGELNPPALATRLAGLGTGQATVAHARRTDPQQLRRALTGDLQWIVLKAMAPERGMRYETANGLAADVRRYLASEPIVARPPTTGYRLSRFVRRHRAGTIAAAVVTVALTASSILATLGMVRATRAERTAAAEARAAQEVTRFLVDLFSVSLPSEARGNAVTARDLLDRGAERVGRDLVNQPALQGRIMHTMGTVYTALGLYQPGKALLRDALRVREGLYGPADTLVAQTLGELGAVSRNRGEYDEALRDYDRALGIRRAALGPDHPDVAYTIAGMGAVRYAQGRPAEAESLYTEAVRLLARAGVREDERLARALSGLAAVYWSQHRYAQADTAMRRALAIQQRVLPPDDFRIGATLNNLGALAFELGHLEEALGDYARAREISGKTLPPGHVYLAQIDNNMAEAYWKLKRPNEAEPLFRRALAAKERALDPSHPTIASTLNGLAGLLRDAGRMTQAEPLYRRALAIREARLPPGSPDLAQTLRDYAALLRATGRSAEAAAMEQRAGSPGR
ncbi:MAG TPA: serine/threonine-protein kinase [Gemmatimonadaceae bacterium]